MPNPWLSMAMVLGTLVVLMAGLRAWQQLGKPHPEVLRKIVHMGMGLVTLSFPWLFDHAWPVIVLGVISLAGMLALRLIKGLKTSIGSVVTGVQRTSLGELYFPMAVASLFLLYLNEDASNEPRRLVLYGIPLLLLTFADAIAALVGIAYGRLHYETSEGRKTYEGSFAFVMIAFLCVHVPLLLSDVVGRSETLLIAVLLALVAMMFEAISWAGLDNLVLPLLSFLLLRIYLDLSLTELAARLAVTAVLSVLVFLFCARTTLVGSAAVGAVLAGYTCWALGGAKWLVPPGVVFLSYSFLSPRTVENSRRIHNVHAVLCVCSAGLICLFWYRLLNLPEREPEFFFLFTLAFAVHLAIAGITRLGCDYPTMGAGALLALCVFQAWLILFLPYLLLEWFTTETLLRTALALPAVAVGAWGFYIIQPGIRDCPIDAPRWLRQAAAGAVGAILGLVPLYLF